MTMRNAYIASSNLCNLLIITPPRKAIADFGRLHSVDFIEIIELYVGASGIRRRLVLSNF